MIKVLALIPQEKPKVIEIEDNLYNYQEFVEGFIETTYPFFDNVALICNEEGKLQHLPINRPLYSEETGDMYDVLVGKALLASTVNENGEDDGYFHSLTDEQIAKYTEIFSKEIKVVEKILAISYLEDMFGYEFDLETKIELNTELLEKL